MKNGGKEIRYLGALNINPVEVNIKIPISKYKVYSRLNRNFLKTIDEINTSQARVETAASAYPIIIL
jgi:hypothetical protein